MATVNRFTQDHLLHNAPGRREVSTIKEESSLCSEISALIKLHQQDLDCMEEKYQKEKAEKEILKTLLHKVTTSSQNGTCIDEILEGSFFEKKAELLEIIVSQKKSIIEENNQAILALNTKITEAPLVDFDQEKLIHKQVQDLQEQLQMELCKSVASGDIIKVMVMENLDMSEKISRYEQKISEDEKKISGYEQKISEYKQKISEDEKKISGYEQKISEYKQKISEDEKKISGYEQKISEYKQKISEDEKKLSEYEQKILQDKDQALQFSYHKPKISNHEIKDSDNKPESTVSWDDGYKSWDLKSEVSENEVPETRDRLDIEFNISDLETDVSDGEPESTDSWDDESKSLDLKSEVSKNDLEVSDHISKVSNVEPKFLIKKPPIPPRNSKVWDDEPKFSDDEPEVSDGELEVSDDDPEVCDDEPEVCDDEPEVCDGEPEVSDGELELSDDEPEVSDGEPEVECEEPESENEASRRRSPGAILPVLCPPRACLLGNRSHSSKAMRSTQCCNKDGENDWFVVLRRNPGCPLKISAFVWKNKTQTERFLPPGPLSSSMWDGYFTQRRPGLESLAAGSKCVRLDSRKPVASATHPEDSRANGTFQIESCELENL
ncbi:unnamed protein product [Pleuronectes platessa]|uniref:Uncharacterized protein n=1 Tax=Pleuronectes platessa TaxID=8262 RepID=A0A9N7UFI9_PLEPL|nr:unnamed protein product [Pleuronectes platessa]